jgi:nucleoside-diphosphate-sugar epimerase
MKVLITGSNGFIGKSLSRALARHYRVIRQGRQFNENDSSSLECVEFEIEGQTDWGDCLQKVDTVIHLAAVAHDQSTDPHYINKVNVDGTINLALQAAANGVNTFIFMSSIGVLGNKTLSPFNESAPAAPHSPYAESKMQAERALLKIADENEMDVIIIRPVLVYGVGAPGNFAKLLKLVQKTPVLPFALCENKRSFISIDNLVHFILLCIKHPLAKNEIFCISDGTDVSIREFTDKISKGLGKTLIQIPVPIYILRILGKITGRSNLVEQLVGDLQVDSSKARKLLGWTPPVTMDQVLSKLVD